MLLAGCGAAGVGAQAMGTKWWIHGMGMFCEAYVLFAVGNLSGTTRYFVLVASVA